MIKTIFKYPLASASTQSVDVPSSAQFLHVGPDAMGKSCVWLEVDPLEKETTPCVFYRVGTGNPIPEGASQHMGSYVQGPYVWHIYV